MAPSRPSTNRRPKGSGGVFQRCDAQYGCPPTELVTDPDTGKTRRVRPAHKCKGMWCGRLEDGFDEHGNRKRLIVYARTKTEAAEKLSTLRDKRAKGEAGAGVRTTVKLWADKWLPMHANEVRPNVLVTNRGHVNKWIVPTIGTRRLVDLNPGDVRRVHKAVTDAGRSSTTAVKVHWTLMGMLKAARVEGGHAVPGRVTEVKAPRPAASDRADIPVEDLLAILAQIGERDDASRWLFRIIYPLRQGESLGLLWDSLDFNRSLVHLDWQLDQYEDGVVPPAWLRQRHLVDNMWLVEPKTENRQATLPLVPIIKASLEAWREIGPSNDYGLVWVGRDGRPIPDHVDRREWHAIQKKAKVQHPDGRYWHLHETRHAAASILIDEGEDPRTIAAILGQSKLIESYVHIDRAAVSRALGKLTTRLGIEG